MVAGVLLALIQLSGSTGTVVLIGRPFDVLFVRLQHEQAAVRAAKDLHRKALHLYLLNDAADRYAYEVNRATTRSKGYQLDVQEMKRQTSPNVDRANEFGASIFWCEYDGDWTTGAQGYETYLSLWPYGPNAEEAWWRGKLHRRVIGCFDGEGSEEETAGFVKDYAEFLAHFPHGKHRREAAKLLRGFESDLASYKRDKPNTVPKRP